MLIYIARFCETVTHPMRSASCV